MKKLMAAVMVSGLMAAVPVFGDDNPAPTPQPQPVGASQRSVLVRTNGGVDTTQPAWIATQPGGPPGVVQAFRFGGSGPGGNVMYQSVMPKMEKAAWLGISTSHAPQVLLKQMKIKAGLVVDHVEPKSPADEAGLKADDVLEKLDDQLLINPAQLESLVRMHNPSDSITLTILHEGQQTTVTAKLIEHEVLAMQDGGPESIGFPPGVLRTDDGVNTTIQFPPGQLQTRGMMALPDGSGARVLMRANANGDGAPHVEMMTKGGNALVPGFESVYSDGANELTVVHRDNQKVLMIKDASGKQVFEGPIDNAEQQEKIPKELQPSFKAMQKMAEMADKPDADMPPKP